MNLLIDLLPLATVLASLGFAGRILKEKKKAEKRKPVPIPVKHTDR